MTQYTELLAQVHTLIPLCPNNDQIIDQIVLVTLGMQFVKNVLQLKKLNGPLNLQHIQYVGFQGAAFSILKQVLQVSYYHVFYICST